MQSLITIDIVPVIKVRAAPALPLAPLKHLHNLPEWTASLKCCLLLAGGKESNQELPARKDEHPPVQLKKPPEANPQPHLTPRPQHHALQSVSSVLKAYFFFEISMTPGSNAFPLLLEEEKHILTTHDTTTHTKLPIHYTCSPFHIVTNTVWLILHPGSFL